MQIFIVFDGIDGAGKTTQAMLLKSYLEKQGRKVLYTREYTGGEQGKLIKSLLRKRSAAKVSREKWVEMFTADRNEHIKEIKDALKDKIIICDKYYYSTLAYQLDEKEWQGYSSQFLKPDIVFILDVEPKTAIKRIENKYRKTGEKKAYFEKASIMGKVRKKFLMMPTYLKDNIKIINSGRKIEEIFQDITKEIDILLKP